MIKYTVKRDNNSVFISFPYNADVVAFLKTISPRKWHPEDKTWELTEDGFETLKSKFPGEEIEPKVKVENNTESAAFVKAITSGVEKLLSEDTSKPSKTLKPSGLHCNRACYYILKGYEPDKSESKYSWSQCAETGSLRHEAIQSILLKLSKEDTFDYIYINVAEYVEMKQKQGKCLDLRVGSRKGAETHLYNDKLKLSFFCDGIIQKKSTGEYFLFEFKNKKSNKYEGCDTEFPLEHYDQCVTYCMCLDLDKVFLLAENRDNCEITCPPLFIVTDKMKTDMEDKLNSIIDDFNKNLLPPKNEEGGCFFCPYKKYCMFDYNE